LAWSLTGCGQPPAATFSLSEATSGLVPPAAKPVEKALLESFGTPEKLIAWEKFPIDYGAADEVHKDDAGWKLKNGRNLYMRHCLHCHGVAGDGNGPTAQYLNPRPRDYRRGLFKFTSTPVGVKATRADLKRTLQEGIPGTSMPSFLLLSDQETDQLVEYVRWLSIRGEFEKNLVAEMAGDYSKDALVKRQKSGEKRDEILNELKTYLEDFPETIDQVASSLATAWSAAEEEGSVIVPKIKRIDPTEDPKSIERGRALYVSQKAKCYTCHGNGAKGDGTSTVDYWAIPNTTPERKFPERGLHDEWGQPQAPRNLTLGVYRGGRRPIDLYRRVFAGIKGTQMPAFGGTVLTDAEIWDLVNYILAVPYQSQTPTDVMAKVPQ
jgi:mono/diheme cytochrome c family protein